LSSPMQTHQKRKESLSSNPTTLISQLRIHPNLIRWQNLIYLGKLLRFRFKLATRG
jgi:hypothetical protein